jgi:polysaccharide pyruvyl transferase WcaK-like protein
MYPNNSFRRRLDIYCKNGTKGLCSEDGRIIEEPISSVEDLLSAIAATDIVVATRFHNVLLALLSSNKPAIAISFHHRCESRMASMGMSEYCLDTNTLDSDTLIQKFCLRLNAENVKSRMAEKAMEFRNQLDEQYKCALG